VESNTVAQVGQQHTPPTVMTTTTSNAVTSSSSSTGRAVRFGEDEAAVVATLLGLDLSSSMFLSKVCLWVRMEKSAPPERSPLSSCLLYTLDGSNGLFGSLRLGLKKKGSVCRCHLQLLQGFRWVPLAVRAYLERENKSRVPLRHIS
jgi:hypothetical protein